MNDRPATQKQPHIRAKITNDWVDYPHNDLSNAAWFFRERIKKALAERGSPEGLFLDMMACLVMIAFSLEGYVNFVGEKLLDGKADEWAKFERLTIREKIKAIRRMTCLQIDWNDRPYSTTIKLIKLRNTLAHPKTHRAEPREWIAEGTDSAFKMILRNYEPAWAKIINQAFVDEAYTDVEAIWKNLLAAAKIEEHETWSGGSQGIELLDILSPDQAP